MGKIKHLTKIKEYLKKTPVFSLKSLQKIIGKKGNYVYLLVKNLVGKGEINRIVPGFYSLYDDPILTVFCFKPAYLGLQEALSVHNLWEQETNVLILTSRKVRPGVREVFGNNVLIRKINPRYLKDIIEIVNPQPVFTKNQIKLFLKLASYYYISASLFVHHNLPGNVKKVKSTDIK